MAKLTNITPALQKQFEALTSGKYDNFALFSCFVNGEPTAAIVAVDHKGGAYNIHPLFVAVTPGMTIKDHDGVSPAPLFSES